MKRKSQTERILNYLLRGKSITSMQAIKMFGCTRLASRINEIRNHVEVLYPSKNEVIVNLTKTYNVQSSWVTRNGKRYKKYWLA